MKGDDQEKTIGLRKRQVSRMSPIAREVFLQWSGKLPSHRIPESIRERVKFLALQKYVDYNYQHLFETIQTRRY